MLELLVVRHGHSVGDMEDRYEGRADFELTDLGRAQAERAAHWLRDHYMPDEVISSPLKRARGTAERISEICEKTLQLDPELMEWNNGRLAGLEKGQGKAEYPLFAEYRSPHNTYADTESFIQFRTRAELFLSKLIHREDMKDKRICLVSHGGFINMLFSSFLNVPMDSAVSLKTGDTGIHLWQVDAERSHLWQVHRQTRRIIFSNYQEHLNDL
ncbi:histidine phosphatase family protein [Paenibacillus xylanexedens]|uniref:histidine phosphatase family protein n=1 Tax=Paenibacillus xylanexedens TaxID=528191 RepID=UPI0011A774C8|nr:histidine phosphatase family protein [Paenibacillus xylanexedens]